MMEVFVVSIDQGRWERCATAVSDLGLDPVRVEGFPQDQVPDQAVEMLRTRRPRKRAAIRFAMQNAVRIAAGRGPIIQDDTRFLEAPVWDWQQLVSFAAPLPGEHHCPRAFAVPFRLGTRLVEAWDDWTRNACSGWQPVLTGEVVIRPTIVEVKTWQ